MAMHALWQCMLCDNSEMITVCSNTTRIKQTITLILLKIILIKRIPWMYKVKLVFDYLLACFLSSTLMSLRIIAEIVPVVTSANTFERPLHLR